MKSEKATEKDISEHNNLTKIKGFTMIANKLIVSGKKYTYAEFRLYCVLCYHTYQKEYCYPGRLKIAKEMGASVSKVDRVKKSLELKKAIKKVRRGQGKTNIYKVEKTFISEADESYLNCQDDTEMTQKEDEVKQEKINKYLENQKTKSYKKDLTDIGLVSTSESRSEVVFRTMLKRAYNYYFNDKVFLKENNIKKSELELARKSFIYYIVKYRAVLNEEHVRYKQDQVNKCYFGFIIQVQILRNSYNWSLDYIYGVLRQVIDRWFSSTTIEKNNLLLNHYFGKGDNEIFFRCLEYVGLD